MGLCAACWTHFMCHHELWPTLVSHLFSSFNSSLGFAGGKHCQKNTIPMFTLVLQNFTIPGCFPYILFITIFSRYFLLWLVVIAVCGSISVQGTNYVKNHCKLVSRTCLLLQDHSRYKATGVLVRSWLMWTSHHLTTSPPCLFSTEHTQHQRHLSNPLMWDDWGLFWVSPTSHSLQFWGKWIFIYIIIFSGKMYVKLKLQRCLYMNFYQS